MLSSWKTFLLALAATAGIASAASPVWSNPTLLTAVEVDPTYIGTVAPFTESTPYLIIYVGSTGYIAPVNSDKAKEWVDIAKTAFATGKKLNLFYDPDVSVSLKLCTDFDASNNCIVSNAYGSFRPIQRFSLQ